MLVDAHRRLEVERLLWWQVVEEDLFNRRFAAPALAQKQDFRARDALGWGRAHAGTARRALRQRGGRGRAVDAGHWRKQVMLNGAIVNGKHVSYNLQASCNPLLVDVLNS